MSKYITVYKPNELGTIEKIETIDGVVVDGNESGGGVWDNVWSFFYSHGATVGGNEWEKKYKRADVPTDGNGRQYNAASGDWEYTEAANGNANPCEVNYTVQHDGQGSVPVWDGYNGE